MNAPNQISCSECIKFQRLKNRTPDCEKCDRPKIIKSNEDVYYLITKYSNLFVDSNGGVNASGIQLALDVENIPQNERSAMLQKIVTYISTGIRKSREKDS